MKERASYTFDKKTIDILDRLVDSGEFRNKSHVVEYAIKFLKNKRDEEREIREREGGK